MLKNRVKESCTCVTTGNITLTGALASFVAFGTAFANGDTFTYVIINTDDNTWEIGSGTYVSSGNTITRGTVESSSNSNSQVSFATGNKIVFVDGSAGTLTTLADTQTLTNKRVQLRVTTISTGTSISINGDTTDVASQSNTQGAGTLTINAPTGTPVDGQLLVIRLKSTSVQTFSWNSIYLASTDLALPTVSSSGSKWDYVLFMYNSTSSKWEVLSKNFGH